MKTITQEDDYLLNFDNYPIMDHKTYDWQKYDDAIKNNFELLNNIDKRCQKKNSLVGRYFKVSVADGYAYYQIVKENKKSFRIVRLVGLGDDYRCLRYMDGGTFDKKEVIIMVDATMHESKFVFNVGGR